MKIGIDCDGVLTDMTAYICEYGEKWFKRKPVNPSGYSTAEVFGCTEKEELRFGLKYFFVYCKKWPPRSQAVEVNRKLREQGYELYEITARKFVMMKNPLGWYSRHLFKKWIKKHGFKFDGVHFCSESHSPEDKLEGCRRFQVDVMIDDRPEVVLYLANKGIKVLMVDAGYNQDVSHPNVVRVYDWNEIYEKIQSMIKEEK